MIKVSLYPKHNATTLLSNSFSLSGLILPLPLPLNSSPHTPKPNPLSLINTISPHTTLLDHTLNLLPHISKMKPHSNNTPLSLPDVSDVTCMEPSRPSLVVEKLCKTVRLICFLVQNGVSKSKVMHDVHFVMKRGKNLGKTLNNAVVRHHEALTCRSRDSHMSFVSPMDYQFSCSGSPPRLSYVGRRKGASPLYTTRRQHRHALQYSRVTPVHRIAGLCRGDEDTLVGSGEGNYSRGRVKITGPTSMLSDDVVVEQEYRVDEAAEEFIERFYRDLRLQKWLDHCC